MRFPRSSGILLHPTSLPGPNGIGDLGDSAYEFVDFLFASGQKLWQVLPLGPTGYGDSPYACYSAFAGNTLLINPQRLQRLGLLAEEDIDLYPASDRVDFGAVYVSKTRMLARAFERFQKASNNQLKNSFEEFCDREAEWLDDYALFRALKDEHNGTIWNEWEPDLVKREPAALETATNRLRDEIEAQRFYQYLFFSQWSELKAYCHERGIKIIGDIPIFVALDSSDVWTNPDEFKLDEDELPTVIAGVPPDYFSATGQMWGNPIYNWSQMKEENFSWWVMRVRAALEMFDFIRIDHFRGFAAAWEIPAGDKTAERGKWVEVPGRELFKAIRESLGELPIIAEDLGVITPDVEELRDDLGFPGMRILQFAFSSDAKNRDLPHNYCRNTVVYTGTHDNDTTVGWFKSHAGKGSTRDEDAIEREREFCLTYLDTDGEEINWDFIRTALGSVADTAIIPIQDVLGLGNEARMNLPNSTSGNWSWRLLPNAVTVEESERLRKLTSLYGR